MQETCTSSLYKFLACVSWAELYLLFQATVETATEDRVAKINELEQHTSRMAQVIQQMESRFDSCHLVAKC